MKLFVKAVIIVACAAVSQLASAAVTVNVRVINQSTFDIHERACLDKPSEKCMNEQVKLKPQEAVQVISFPLENDAAFDHTITLSDLNYFEYCDLNVSGRTKSSYSMGRSQAVVTALEYNLKNIENNNFTCSNVRMTNNGETNYILGKDENLYFDVVVRAPHLDKVPFVVDDVAIGDKLASFKVTCKQPSTRPSTTFTRSGTDLFKNDVFQYKLNKFDSAKLAIIEEMKVMNGGYIDYPFFSKVTDQVAQAYCQS